MKDLATRAKQAAGNGNGNGELERPAGRTLIEQIRGMEKEFQAAMPHGVEAAQLIRDATTAIKRVPKLGECDVTTVLGSLMTCCQLNLRVGVLGHAWVLPFWNGRRRMHEAQLIVGYQGYAELAMRSGRVADLVARTVHEKDVFDIDYGIANNLVHKPKLDGDRGEPIGYYSIVRYTTGGYAFWHMSKPEVEAHRDRFAMTRTKEGKIFGPWVDHFDSMAQKSTFRALAKFMPKSSDDHLAYALAADEKVRRDLSLDRDAMLHGSFPDPNTIDGTVEPDDGERAQITAGASREQLGAIATWFTNHDLSDKDRIEAAGAMAGKAVTSTEQLTKAEASAVLDRLARIQQEAGDVAAARTAVQEILAETDRAAS